MNPGGTLPRASLYGARGAIHAPLSRIAAYLLVAVAMVFSCTVIPRMAHAAYSDHTVQGVSPRGTTIDLFDYWTLDDGTENDNYNNEGINEDHQLKFNTGSVTGQNDVINSWTGKGEGPRTGIVENTLTDGYPVIREGNITGWVNYGNGTTGTQSLTSESLDYLFNLNDVSGKETYPNVQGLLQVDSDGYYYYNASLAQTIDEGGSFESANFASFDKGSNSFILYDTWAVYPTGGYSPKGQFFPFNTASDVFQPNNGGSLNQKSMRSGADGYDGISGDEGILNHYFGMHMSTRFVQQDGGHVNNSPNADAVTYEFSGDDDVWIYIDDVLVGDLGGIHDAASVTIDFSTGKIVVKNSQGEEVTPENMKTLRECFEQANRSDQVAWSSSVPNTFADNTYHTLDFFYLERGNNDSNMSLKYNLVTIPETDITKVDQEGNPISAAEFKLYKADADYNVVEGADPVCRAVTERNGMVVLLDENDYPVTFDDLWEEGVEYLVLREEKAPDGYSLSSDVKLRLEDVMQGDGELIALLSSNAWESGSYALPKVTVTASDDIRIANGLLTSEQKENGTMFAVVKRLSDGEYIYGNPTEGWQSTSDLALAAQKTAAAFVIATNGAYQTEIDGLPGRIQEYSYLAGAGNESKFTVEYYYSDAPSLDRVTSDDCKLITNSESFNRQFSAHLYVADIINRFAVQKLDETGEPVDGATFVLYKDADVSVNGETGVATLNDDAQPIDGSQRITAQLTKEEDGIALSGAAVYSHLKPGTYWLAEQSAPDGYKINKNLTKILVTESGVYADAGTADDGIQVERGLGRLVRSMVQFATNDGIDATLHDIVVTPQIGSESVDGQITWKDSETDNPFHLEFSDNNSAPLDYSSADEGGPISFTVDEGIPRLTVAQCDETNHVTMPRQEIEDDLTGLYTGTTVVKVTDIPTGDFELSKTVDPDTVTDPFVFDLEFEQKLPVDNEETGEVSLGIATANYIKKLFPGDYNYTITKSGVSDPVEQGTLTIGEATASGENPGGDTPGEGNTEASAKYIITSVTNDELSGVAESHFAASTETGAYQVKLAHGEKLTISALPVYTQITATEVEPDGSYLTTVKATPPEVTVTEVTASDAETDVDTEDEGDSVTAGTETETAADGEDAADSTDDGNTDVTAVEEPALDEGELAVTDGEQATDADEGTADVLSETVVPQVSATSVYTATTIIEKQVIGDGADASASYNASIAFTNTQSANATINVQKTLVGTDWATDKGAYEFTINRSAETPNAPLPDQRIPIDVSSDDSFDEGSETEPDEPSATVRVGSFEEIAFTGVDEDSKFAYEITETHPTDNGDGWTYDNHAVTVTVTFDRDETTHELEAVVTYDNSDAVTESDKSVTDAAAFTNTYSATTIYAGLQIVKAMSGRDLADNEFSFNIVPVEDNPSHDGINALFAEGGELSGSISFGEDHTKDKATISAFDGIKFTQDDDEKVFCFTVSEAIPEENNRELGVTYDQSQYEVKIKVIDNNNGTMHTVTTVTQTVDADGKAIEEANRQPVVYDSSKNSQTPSMTFANSYETQPTSSNGVDDGVFTKSFTGRAWTENDSFTFDLSKVSYQANDQTDPVVSGPDFDAMPMPGQTSVTVSSKDLNENSATEASFGFGEITFSKPGIYTYKVVEENVGTTFEGISYSDNVATVTFTVTDSLTGQYKVECNIVYSDSSENRMFQNVYTPTGNLFGSTNLNVEKSFTGRPNDAWLESDEFSFVLKPDMADEATSTAVNAGQIVIENAVENSATITIDGDDTVKAASFGNIIFTQPGKHTYQFLVYEVQPTNDGTVTGTPNAGVTKNGQGQLVLNGITYDSTVKTVKIEVSDDGKGNLTAQLAEDSNELSFVNTYGTDTEEIKPVEAGLSGIKNLNGRTWENGDSFTFTLTPGESSNPDGTTMVQDDVIATMPKTKEVTITPATDDSATDGNTAEFSFGGDGTETFTFSKPGTYRYLIREDNPYAEEGGSGIIGVNYDETTYRLTVVVKDDGMGNLSIVSHKLSKRAAGSTGEFVDLAEGEGIVFNNEYDTNVAEININAAKVLTGRPAAMNDNEFKLRIADAGWKTNGSEEEWKTGDKINPMPQETVEGTEGDAGAIVRGDVQFGSISFTADHVGKTFRYAITEVQPTEDGTMDGTPLPGAVKNDEGQWVYKGVTYDNDVKYVTVEVTSQQIEDPENPGHYIEAVYAQTSGEATWEEEANAFVGGAIFTNTYTSTGTLSGATELVVEKTFTGRENDMWTENDTFTFTLTGSDGSPMPAGSNGNVKTITVGADDVTNGVHANHFGDIIYTTADNGKAYTYTIEETAGNVYGVTYSKASYTVTVKVFDNDDGTLDIDKTMTQTTDDKGASDGIAQNPTVAAFANTYDVPEDTKKVEADVAGVMTDVNGQLVGVGDVLTYTIHWVNDAIDTQGVAVPAEITVSDGVPAGTEYVEGSAEKTGGVYDQETRSITWELGERDAAAQGDVSFQVRVTDDAVRHDAISNTATIEVGENEPKQTNEVAVDVPEKTAEDTTADNGLQVGDVIKYSIEWANKTGKDATVTIRDTLPEGITYNDDASDGGQYDEATRTIEWQFEATIGAIETVTFSATVNEDATVVNDPVKNTAYVTVDNDTYTTNTTTGEQPATGNLTVSKKVVAENGATVDADKSFDFAITLTDAYGKNLTKGYTARIFDADNVQVGSEFEISGVGGEGIATTFSLKDGQHLVIYDLPEGAQYTVTEILATEDEEAEDAGYSQKVTDGKASDSIPVGEENASVTFTNTYTPGKATFDPKGEHGVAVTKTVTGNGGDAVLPEGYSFNLTVANAVTGDGTGVVSGANQTKQSDSDGSVPFDAIVFDQVGAYEITVSEVVPVEGDEGFDSSMTYDKHKLVYTVNVTDSGKGQLIAKVDPATVEANENVFSNVYYNNEDAKHVYDAEGALIDGKLVGVGETLTYKIDWVNTAIGEDGSPSSGTVTVIDTLPKGTTVVPGRISDDGKLSEDGRSITWTIEAQAAQTGTVSFQVTVDEAAAGSTLSNQATVNDSTTNSVANPVPGKVETTNPDAIGEGTVLTYQISFVNTDGDGASAQVIDTLTQGQAYNAGSATVKVGDAEAVVVEPSVSGDAASGQTLTWNPSDLPAGAEVIVTFDVTVTRDAGTSVDNTATVNGHTTNTTTTPYPTDDKKDVAFTDDPEVSIEGKLVGVGDALTYTIDWAAGDEGGTVTVTDRLPDGTAYVNDSADNNGSYDENPNTITWNLGNQPAGARGTVSFKVTVTDEAVTVIENTATIKVGENAQDVSVAVDFPKKEAIDTTPGTGYQVGDVIEYTIEYRNDSDAAATVTVTDNLPEGLDVALDENGKEIISAPGSYDPDTHTITWTFENLPAGTEGAVTFSARVNEQATVVKDPVTNQATIKIGNNEHKTNTTGGDPDEQPKTGDLTISKEIVLTDGQGTVIDGDKEFTFEVALIGTDGQSLTGTYKYAIDEAEVQDLSFANGSATITLTHGQTAKITGLPEGARYTVHEILDPEADAGYRQTAPAGENGAPVDAEGAIVSDAPPAEAAFTNTYYASPADPVSVNFEKQLTGRDWKDTDEFGFTLVSVADESVGVTADDLAAALGDSATTASVNSEQKTFSFGEFTFTKVGTYVYQVTEDQPAEGVDTQGVTYSKDIAKVTFTVTDNKAGKLQVETVISGVTISETGAGIFVNSYATKPTSTEGQVDLRGTKTLIGRDSLENEKFEFTLEPTGDTVQAVNEGKLTLPSNPMTESVANLKDGVAVGFEFDDIVVNAAGTYTFAVKETSIPETDQNGMTYDRHIGRLTLTATDDDFDGDFEITAEFGNVSEGADENDWSFENVYNPTPFVYGDDEVEILGGHKYVEDNAGSFAMADGQFTFTMRAQEAGNPMPDGLEVTTDNEGRSIVSVTNTGTDAANYTSLFDFGTITFNHGDMAGAQDNGDGTFTKVFQYNIYENETNMPAGISPQNPGRTYTVTITVTEDVTDGTFEAEASCELITPGAEENQPVDMGKIDFTNVYDAKVASGSTQIFKTLNGRNWREGDTFTFDVSMTADGVAEEDLPTFDFSNTGATVDGFTTADGSLSYSITINPSTSGTGNTYAFSTGTATYTHEGVYVYTIAERDMDNGAVPSVSKDKTVYTVTVTVTDVNNVLQRTAVIDPATESGRLDFTNTYTTTGELDPEGDYAITVEKQLVGRDWIADNPETEEVDGDVFRAMLTAQDSVVDGVKLAAADVPMPGGKTGGVDTIELTATSQSGVFDAIAYTRPGIYNYTLTEVQENSIPGVTYSKAVYNVVVTATDKGDGTMTVTSEMTKVADDAGAAIDPVEPVDGATFTNTYSVTPTTLSGATYLRVSKVLEGRDWLAGIDSYTFTLELTSGDGSQVTMPEQKLTIDANTPDHAAAFGDITFAAEGTYTFTVTESATVAGVTNDAQSVRTVTVDVVDNHDGTLTASVTSITAVDAAGDTVDSDLAFTNIYDPADATLEGEGAIKVQKTLTGRAWAEGETYSFTIAPAEGYEDAPMPENATVTVGAPTEGPVNTAAFGTMTFSQASTYVYKISENVPGEGDEGYRAMMAYDAHVATVTVAVTENQAAGTLEAHVTYDNSTAPSADDQYVTGAAAFTNTQNLKCELPLSGTKTLEGRDFQTGDSFTFTVTADDGAPLPVDAEGNVVSEVTINPTAGSVATVDFGTITFTAAGEYVYRIAEQAGKASGMTYDTVEHAVIVTVTDDGQGNLMAAVAPETAANLAWTNSWTFVPGDPFMLTGTKTLTGAQLHNGDFTFLIEPQDNAPMGDSLPASFNGESAQNEDGSWTAPVTLLSNITFTAPGDYVYLVSEVNDGRPGYTYDASKYRVTVRVAQDGSISWTVEKNSNGETDDEGNLIWTEAADNAVVFSNSYAVTEDGTLDGSVNLAGTKTLAGRDWIADAAEGYVNDSFTFVLAAGDEATQAAIDGNPDEGVDPTVVMPAETAVVLQGGYTDGQQVPFSFGDITFKAAGVYTFTIAEQQPGDEGFVGNTGGMAYDSHDRTVVVSVADNGKGGLTATVVTEPTEDIPVATNGDTNWTNTYTPVFDGATTVNLNGTKVLEGSTLTAGQFYFKVTPLDGAPMGDTWEFGNTNGLGANGALENVGDIELLRNITYTVADMGDATEKTFRYVVTEEIPSEGDRMPGLAYDGSAYLASVTVTDDLAGNLVASAPSIERGVWDGTTFTADEDQAGVEGVVFTNGYTVSGTTAAPVQVTKVLAGNRTAPLAAGEFEFELGIVSADPADGLTLPEETTASNAADGTVSFGEVSFSKPGTYVLSVAEVVPEGAEQNGDGSYTLDGVTYDTHAVTMTYTVVDQNAQLVATLGAVEGDTTFTNTYNATETLDGAANLTVTKAVEGDFTWKEGTSFTFALTGADIATQEAIANGTVVLPDNADGIAIAYNAADPDAPHTASFGDITFKAAGDYLFAITEQQGDIAGMTYDVEQHLVSVAVTDNGDGTLAVVPDADTVNPTITNTYEPTEAVLSGAGNLTVTKNLVGRDWQEGDSFTFVLEADMDDETTADAMNDGAIRLPGNAGGITVAFDANDPEAAHSASFGDIAFTRAGTYRFTVTELAGSIDGVVYDTAAHEVVVTVVDNGDGTLGFAADGVVGANPTVTNVFTAPIDYSARSEIVISKTLDGRPATDGQFSFTVTPADEASALKLGIPEDGYALSTPAAGDGEKASVGLFATMRNEGMAPVTFTRDDAGTTFSYTVTENGTAPAGYTYDASVYTVDITVTDDPSAGGLTVTTQASDGAGYTMMTTVTNATEFAQPVEIPFVNSYRASTDVEGGAAAVVNGTKELVGTAMREFSFVLEGVAGTNTEGYVNTAVNDGTSFSFTLDYDQDSFTAGAIADENGNRSEDFVYTLHEVGAGEVKGGITYDDARYRATVTVADNGDGTMAASVTKLEQLVVDEAGTESWIPADAAAFTNTYAAATSVSLDVDKVLSGRDMTAADSYEFVAYAYDRATQTIDRTGLVATGSTPAGQTAADGTPVQVAMSSIEYTIEKLNADTATPWVDVTDEAGQPTGARTKTYDYAIEEVVGSDLNVSYAPEVFYAQVVVTDDGQGNLTATKAYFADAAMQQQLTGEDGSSTVPTFVNTYLPDATSFHLTGTKITTFVNVDPGTEPELRFMYDIYLEENGTSELVASGWSYANGTVSADIPVAGEGSFTYRIVERYAGTTSGTVTYDDAVYYLTLEVARNADTGIYDFAPTYYRVEDDGTWTPIDAADLTFENTYDGAAGTTVSLGATKVLEGATFEQLGQLNDKFGFSLYEGDEYTGTKLGEGTITGVDANGNGIVTFPNLTYTFYLQDQPAAETPGEGEQVEGGETAETPEEGTEAGQPDGSEEGTEGGQTDQGGQTGTAVPSDPNAGQPSGEGGATEPDQPAEPSGDAGAVEPVEPVTPAEPDQPAADVPAETPSVDETPAVEGTPEVAPEAPAEDASGDAGVQAASIADLFVASEAIADDADAEPFTVDIVDTGAEAAEVADGAADGAAESAADGQAVASGEAAPAAPAEPVIVSDDLGTHVYTIVENVPAGSTQNEDGTWTAPNGVTYDGTKYRVTVEVAASYDAATQKATMTATVTGIARSDSHGSFEDGHATPVDPTNPAASIVFTNSYTARQPVEVSFAGTKNLTGRDMAEGEFSFAVLEGETPVATATNAANGTVSFSFGVTTPGTHTYTVVEADGGKGGVDYDTAPRTVTVEVGVNPDGTLAVESVALPEGGLVFNNTYTASGSTEAVIEGTKALTGRTMAEGEFRFVVVETVDGVENIVAAGENQAPGEDGVAAITFAPIAYDAEDLGKTFTYQVRELDLGAGGVTYDTAAFTVQVAVVDDLDGTISTEVTYLDGPVAFENSYGTVDGAKVEVTPEATKTLTGRDMADGEFVFTVTDAATGNVVATGANTADGKVVWDAPITLTAKGDYEFAIAEVNGRQDGVTYDDATYRLLVTVADDGEGGLTVESLDYPDGTPAFANSYEEPEKPADPDKPSIPGGPTESVPQTGDDTNLAAAAALGLGGLGAALLGGGALLRRRAGR